MLLDLARLHILTRVIYFTVTMAELTETIYQVSLAELEKHNTKGDCWVAVHRKVWDVTEFLDEHPGGPTSRCLAL